VGATEKLQKAHSKEYEKVLKVSSTFRNVESMLLIESDHCKPIEGRPPLRPELGGHCRNV